MLQLCSAGRVVSLVAALVALAGCGTTNPSFLNPAIPADVAVTDYMIGPGDALTIHVWRNEDLNTNVQVRPDGKISTPLVDDLQAVGKTPSQLATDIEAVLAEFIRTPDVTVIITQFGIGAFDNQIRVVGAG